ncbi:MAG: acetoacetyl-CoA reductase [Gammaproteobacteria bacterium]|nr:acetoacetyl-CoA reductase [Gammaproteobacteria bacterium]
MKKVALVTGGTGGIGTAICKQLHHDGMTVIAGYYNGGQHEKAQGWLETVRAEGFEHMYIAFGNVSDYESAKTCIDGIVEEHGPISVLVNNAGITRDSMFKRMSVEQWQDVIKANLDSLFNMSRLVINGMLENGWGRMVNISSINGQKGQFGQTNYSAAKAGMHGFTKALAQEVASKGITINTVSPGYVATSMVKSVKPEILEGIVANIPVGRLGEPEEIAHAVSYLVSEHAGYITGSNLAINGGQHMF